MEMGHGDELVIADANFPAAAIAQRLVRSEGNMVTELLEAVLKFSPLDPYINHPVALMQVVRGEDHRPTIWETYKKIIQKSPNKNPPVKPERLFPDQ
jgi:L-fucose mutarotase